jgi:hypothetical protein
MQSILVIGVSAFDDQLDPGLVFVGLMLLGLVIAVAFTYGVPEVGTFAFAAVGLTGIVGGMTSDYRDLVVWGSVSLLISGVAYGGVRERASLIKAARMQSSQLQSLVTAVAALSATSPVHPIPPVTAQAAVVRTPTPPAQTVGPASLSLSHSAAAPGTPVGAMLHGFGAGLPVALGWRRASGAIQTLGSAVIGDAGWTHLSFTVPAEADPGEFTVLAATARDQTSRPIRVIAHVLGSSHAA